MVVKFNRSAAIKKVWDNKQMEKGELAKLILDYYMFSAITAEEKEELLGYINPVIKSDPEEVQE